MGEDKGFTDARLHRASRSARDFGIYYRGGKPCRPECADTGRLRCVPRRRKRLAKTLVGCPGQINGLRDHLLNRIVVSPGPTAITGNGWSFTELEQVV
jgi:hypothetical protein